MEEHTCCHGVAGFLQQIYGGLDILEGLIALQPFPDAFVLLVNQIHYGLIEIERQRRS